MPKEKMIQLVEALASVGYKIAKFNLRTKAQAEFDFDEIELLIYPVPPNTKEKSTNPFLDSFETTIKNS